MSKGKREIRSKLVGEREHIKDKGGEKVSRIPDVVKGEREISRERKYSRIPDA